ncbi:hypothetical protein Lal_00020691 [Lupinus albus]|nr:hypothetical protein Lal_00020691 [Lupinus albus]
MSRYKQSNAAKASNKSQRAQIIKGIMTTQTNLKKNSKKLYELKETLKSVTDAVERFTESISYDKKLYKHDIMGSKAHASMLAHQVGYWRAMEGRERL